ncbi:MAG: DUF6141 family protein [Candidatus Pacebacteria bacterium]|nr:DUF6141 family protein [Candidatus Paceibacterota bacterium]
MSKTQIIFSEKQRQKPFWVWLVLGVVFAIFLYTFIMQIVFNSPVGNQPASDWVLYLNLVLILLLGYLFHFIGLNLEVREDAIYYKFTPFHLKWRQVAFSQIKKAYVRTYHPITEYGGWGWRLGVGGQGRALTVKGNKGLQVELLSGKKILFGTQKPKELDQAIPNNLK